MKVARTIERENVTGADINMGFNSDDFTFAHEFGHCIGLPDEYSDLEPQIVRYYKPDGTFAKPIKLPGESKSPVATDESIMSTHGLDKVFPRHAWNIAIEVRNLLTQKTGRNITCNII